MQCPHCHFENLTEARFCGQCGARLVRDCHICGLANPHHYQYCHRCGANLTQADVSTSARTVKQLPSAEPTPISAAPTLRTAKAIPADTTSTPSNRRLTGERRIATIIMADVQGSTDLLEDLGTEAWVEMMNRIFQILETEIYRFGGKVDQFRGDGLVAFFGATAAHEDDPERAVLAALAMQKALIPYATELTERAHVNLQLRVGVNTGEVIVTSVGDRRKYSEDTAMGEGITLAARMETAAEAQTVLVSENTYVLVKDKFEWLDLGETRVKGIRQPVRVYRPLHPSHETHETYDLSNPLIGRDAEFAALRECVESLHTGHGGVITMTGERGMGKSLLLREVRHYYARQRALLEQAREHGDNLPNVVSPTSQMLRGRCRSYDQSQPYTMWIDLLRNWLDIQPDEDKVTVCERLQQYAESLWGARMTEYYPYLADFLDLPLEPAYADHLRQLDAEGRRQQRFVAIRSWVAALASAGPLAISFSDMHWSDATSLDLLRYCLPLCDQLPVLWLLIFRPERDTPVWKFRYSLETDYPHRLTAITLPPLDHENSERFIAHMIGPDVLPPETVNLVIEKAQGNPYYIQELIRALIEQGALVKKAPDEVAEGESQWQAVQTVTDFELPDSLHTLILARIDRLSPEEHTVLQMASVIGTIFWCNVLQALRGDAELDQKHLTSLLRAQLIREHGRDADLGTEYVFKSPLIREAAYESLLSTQRATYHQQVADYLEQHFAVEARTPYFMPLAYHYSHAGQPDKELFYTLKQAEHAKAIYANAEAGAHYSHALTLLDAMEQATDDLAECNLLRTQRFDALYGRKEVHSLTGNFKAMWADARALLPLARQLDNDQGRYIDAILEQPGIASNHDEAEVRNARPLVQEALALVHDIGDQNREIKVHIAQANQCLTLGDPAWEEHAETALALAQEIGDLRYEARLLIGLGKLYAKIDQQERSLAYIEEAAALALSHAIDDMQIQTALLGLLGIELEREGDYYQLLIDYVQEQLHLSREIGHRPLESKALMKCGIVQGLYLGDYETGISLLEECQQMMPDTSEADHAHLLITHIYIALDMLPEAQACVDAVVAGGRLNHKHDHIMLDFTTAMLYHALGDSEHLQAALPLLTNEREEALNDPLLSRQYAMASACKAVSIHLALAKRATDPTERELHHSNALKDSQAAYTLYKQLGYAQILECLSEEVLFRHAQALTANGYEDEGIKYLRRAYDEMIRKHAMIPPESAFRRTYLDNIPLHQDIRIAYAARVGSILAVEPKVLVEK